MTDQTPSLGRQIAVLNRLYRSFFSTRMASLGLPMLHTPQFLVELYHSPGMNQDTLASHLVLEKTLVAKCCKELVQQGLIRREINPDDRREYRLFLTDAGSGMIPQILDTYREWNRRMAADLTDEEQRQLHSLLSRAVESARTH